MVVLGIFLFKYDWEGFLHVVPSQTNRS